MLSATSDQRRPWWYRPGFYVVLLLLLIVVHGAWLRNERFHRSHAARAAAEAQLTDIEQRISPEHVRQLAARHPSLLVTLSALTLLGAGVFLAGLLLDALWLRRWRRVRELFAAMRQRWLPVWSVGDLWRLIILALWWITVFPLVEMGYTWLLRLPDAQSNASLLIASTYLSGLLISMVMLLARTKDRGVLPAIGLHPAPRPAVMWRGIVGYVTAAPCLAGLLFVAARAADWMGYTPPPHPLSLFFLEERRWFIIGYGVMFTCVVAPFVEEIIFRGVMFPALRSRLPFWQAAALSGVFFGALHANWVSFLPIAWLGVLLAYLYEVTGSLYASVLVHGIHNGIMVLLMFVYRALSRGS